MSEAKNLEMLTRQIEAAKQILLKSPIPSKEYSAWNDQTRTCLIQVYGERSPNIDTITGAVGSAPAWLFMPDDVAEQHDASCLENKIKLLEGCVVALRRKAKRVA
ncbi:MAG: hypothetical protein PVG35_06630 [Desulfobacterales bacterium]|jgi:hypothetical protein